MALIDPSIPQWSRAGSSLRGVELRHGGKVVATLMQKGLFGLKRYIGSYDGVPIELKVSSDWHNMTDKITITRIDTSEKLGIVTVFGIFQDGLLTMSDGREYELKNSRIDHLQGWHVSDRSGRDLALTLADFSPDFSMPGYYFQTLDMAPGDPDQWLLAAITLHFILRYNFPG